MDSRPLYVTLEAQQALAAAPTLRTAAVLLDQWAGALSREVAHIERVLTVGEREQSSERLHALLRWSTLGLHLTLPWRVVLAGRPNVGKSSLINALLGYQRSIVFDQPGTTRDVVTAPAALDGWPVELTDTAGLRAADHGLEPSPADELEAAGIAKVLDQVAAADQLVLVVDATQAPDSDIDAMLRHWSNALVVLNKSDLLTADQATDAGDLSLRSALRTSAITGDGVEALGKQIAARLVPDAPPPGAAVPFTQRQEELLRAALAAVERGDLGEAGRYLRAVLAPADA
jgi:tRNA modification GTPase